MKNYGNVKNYLFFIFNTVHLSSKKIQKTGKTINFETKIRTHIVKYFYDCIFYLQQTFKFFFIIK